MFLNISKFTGVEQKAMQIPINYQVWETLPWETTIQILFLNEIPRQENILHRKTISTNHLPIEKPKPFHPKQDQAARLWETAPAFSFLDRSKSETTNSLARAVKASGSLFSVTKQSIPPKPMRSPLDRRQSSTGQ